MTLQSNSTLLREDEREREREGEYMIRWTKGADTGGGTGAENVSVYVRVCTGTRCLARTREAERELEKCPRSPDV